MPKIFDGRYLLTDSGYLNFDKIYCLPANYIFIIGGRGCGKTYSSIKHFYENNMRILFMRRTQTQLDLINIPMLSPFTPYNEDTGSSIIMKKVKKEISLLINEETDDNLGFACALSTMANLRGINGRGLDYILFDEFIPEPHQSKIREEGNAFKNVCETLARNREMEGKEPLRAICLSNSDSIAAPIFMDWGLVNDIYILKERGFDIGICLWEDRRIAVILVNDTPILRKKREEGSLYRADNGGKFTHMATSNDFIYDDFSNVVSRSLNEYVPIAVIGMAVIYKHKSRKKYYVSKHKSGAPVTFNDTELGRREFRVRCDFMIPAIIGRKVEFESYDLKVFLTETILSVKMR